MTQTRSQPAAVKTPVPEPRHVWRHAVEWTLVAGLVTFFIPFAHMPVLAAAIITVVAGGTVAGSVAMATHSPQLGLFACVAALAAAGWVTAAKLDGLWHWPVLAALVAAGGILLVAGGAFYDSHVADRRMAEEADASRAAMAECRKITAWFSKIGLDGVVAVSIEPARGSRKVSLRLPSNGSVTLTTLRMSIERLAVTMKADAASIAFDSGKHGGEAVMILDDGDILEEDVPFPEHTELLTITRPIAVAMASLGEMGKILFRELNAHLTGKTGSGKSNLLNVLIAQFSSCVDVIIFCIDLSGGSLASPWIKPWIDDEVLNGGQDNLRPVIDWVATTREEAWEMLCAVDRLVTSRREENGAKGRSKLTPHNKKPAVIFIGDEVVDVLGQNVPRAKQTVRSNDQMIGMATEITRQDRAAAISAIWATQRPTVTMAGSGDLKSQCDLRISLGQVAEMDAASAVPDDNYAAKLIARLRHPGTGLVVRGGDKPKSAKVWKFFRLDPDPDPESGHPEDVAKIARIATRNSRHRPVFDEADLLALGDAYRDRWEKSPLFQRVAPDAPAAGAGAPAAQPAAATTAVIDREAEKRADLEAFNELVGSDPDLATLSKLGAGFTRTGDMQPWQLRMYALLAETPLMGMSTGEIRIKLGKDGYDLTREHISKTLARDAQKGIVRSKGKNSATRWFLGGDAGSQ
jgi:hypothetical protein